MKTSYSYKMNRVNGYKLLLLSILSIFALPASYAANYYWVGGSGNWSDYANHWATTSGGTIFHNTIPSLNDDVFFDAGSFSAPSQTVLFDNTFMYCNNMNWTGAQFNPILNGLGNTLNVYGSLTLIPAMSWNVKRINFSGSGIGNTITTSGNLLDTLYFNGTGSYALMDNITSKSVFIYDGTFSTNNYNMTQQRLTAGIQSATVNVDLGTSTITCNDLLRVYDGTINLNSASANLIFNNAIAQSIYFWSSGHTFNDITFNSRGEVIGSFNCQNLVSTNLFYINSNFSISSAITADFFATARLDCIFNTDTLRMNNPGYDLRIRQLNVSDEFVAYGICGSPIQISPIDFLPTGVINKPSGNLTVDYVILTSINAIGGALYTANNSIDGGGNSGWTINSSLPRTLHWVGGAGNWNDESKWSLSSGGSGGNCIPSSVDNVIFDINSFSQTGDTVLITGPAVCKNVDWTNVSFIPTFASGNIYGLKVFGSIALTPAMIHKVNLEFSGSATGNTILTAGQNISSILINATGSWSLSDELNCESIQVYQGTFATNNFNINAKSFAANGLSSSIFIDLGTSTLNLSTNYMAFDNNLTISSSNANLVFNNVNGDLIYSQMNIGTFNNVTVLSSTYFLGKLICNTFISQSGLHLQDLDAISATFDQSFTSQILEADNLFLNSGVHNLAFDTLTVNTNITVANNCDNTLSLKPYTATQANFYKSSGTVTLNYTYIQNIAASGGANFIADNSWNLGNNTGWSFNTPASRDLYWIGGTGSWHDNTHWSLTTGGAGGNCPPGQTDNVFFDSGSFLQSNDTVYVSPTFNMYCNNLSFAGVPNGTTLHSNSGTSCFINGSISLVPEVNLYDLSFEMTSSLPGNTIASAGNDINRLIINGTGTFSMLDPVNLGNFVSRKGSFYTNGFAFNSGDINMGAAGFMDLGNSTLTLIGFYASGTINGSNADIIMTSSFLGMEVINGNFNSVTFTGTAHTQFNFSCNRLYAMGDFTDINSQIIAGYAEFHDDVTLEFPFSCDSIILDNPGKLVKISQLTINDAIVCNGNSSFPIQVEGYNGAGVITKATGQLCMDYVLLKDIQSAGGAQFYAGINSVDLGGNTGWLFTSCVPLLTDVWPGDANYDLVADNNDILNIGLAYGYTGPVRTSASLLWVVQPSQDWSFQFANTTNLKHADTDGNGIVNDDDTTAVSLNYGLTHLRIEQPVISQLPSPVLYIESNPDTVYLSDSVEVSIYLGTNLLPVDSIYGIAFTVNFDPAYIDSSFLTADFSGCWMGTQQVDLLAFNKNLLAQGSVDLAIVRTDQQNITGFGLLARLGIVIVDNVGAKVTMPITLSDVTAITSSEFNVPLIFENDSLVIDTATTTGFSPELLYGNISYYPNPANSVLNINSEKHIIDSYEVYNQLGGLITKGNPESTNIKINTDTFSHGLYIIKLMIGNEIHSKRFEVLR